MQPDTTLAPSVAQEPSCAATEDAGAPVLAPGLYRLHGPRLWRHDELTVIWVAGLGWAVVPRVALAALPAEPAEPDETVENLRAWNAASPIRYGWRSNDVWKPGRGWVPDDGEGSHAGDGERPIG
jgi:hypothetical protein